MLGSVSVFFKAVWNQHGHRRSLEVVPEELAVAYARHAWSSGTYGGLFVFDKLVQAVAYLEAAGLAEPGYEIWECEIGSVFPVRNSVNPTFLDIPTCQSFWGMELRPTAQLITPSGTYGTNRLRLLNRVWKSPK